LFTGPLYFIYKIFSVINLCERLKTEFPENNFVPVYWLAGEDHDFEEVNHFNVFGKKIEWNNKQGGPLGTYKTDGLAEVKKQFSEILGNSPNAEFLNNLFETAYLEHNTMADATRFLVNELFGAYGLVIVDGNAKEFKELFIPYFEKDIFENTPFKHVEKSIEKLKHLKYHTQVNPREINCFYMEGKVRARIEKENDSFKIVDQSKKFSAEELRQFIKTNPENISPNVVLRPCYQQLILPNLVYIGGPGELAYWLEYKDLFTGMGLFFPVLTPRKFITIIDSTTLNKINKLGFKSEDFFEDEQVLINNYIHKNGEVKDLKNYKEILENLFGKLAEEAAAIDKTLISTVEAEKQKALNSINMVEQKFNRALKQRSETELNQVRAVKAKFFPDNTPQERFDNFSMYYSVYGKELLDDLKKALVYTDRQEMIFLIDEKKAP
jgi:bacillithiol biosynthesis cysteine-adding enzyme BshC